jgi:hypothetical protein
MHLPLQRPMAYSVLFPEMDLTFTFFDDLTREGEEGKGTLGHDGRAAWQSIYMLRPRMYSYSERGERERGGDPSILEQ